MIDTDSIALRVGAGLSCWVCVHADAPLRDYSITCHEVLATLRVSWRGDSLTTASCFRATCCVHPVSLWVLSFTPLRPSGMSRPTVSTAVAGDALDQAVVASATPRSSGTVLPRTSSKFDMGGGTGSLRSIAPSHAPYSSCWRQLRGGGQVTGQLSPTLQSLHHLGLSLLHVLINANTERSLGATKQDGNTGNALKTCHAPYNTLED